MIKTLTMKAKRTMKGAIEDMFVLDNNNTNVRRLKKTEREFKKAYKLDGVVVKYVDPKGKAFLTSKESIKGYYNYGRKVAVVFVDGDVETNTKTLLHELTHAYQDKYMNKQFQSSHIALANKTVLYANAWHEKHARHCADVLALGYIGKIDLRYAMDYAIVA